MKMHESDAATSPCGRRSASSGSFEGRGRPACMRIHFCLMRILVVEDDPLLAAGLSRVLNRGGHAVDGAATGIHADNLLRATPYELVVLDVGSPDIDGFEVLRRIRLRRTRTSVLVLTARDAIEDRVHGLDLGA